MGDHFDPHAHGCPANPLDGGVDRNYVAHVNRRDELHGLDCNRGHRPPGAPRGDDAGRDIHLAKHPAAENMPVGIDVRGPGDDPQDGLSRGIAHISVSL
jgi:hypothetical protein